MFFDSIDAWWWPYVFITLAGALPTAIWRWAGVLLVGNLDETSQWLVLIRCVATALVAAVIAQFIFFPDGALATLPLWLRVGAALTGFFVFLASGRRIIVGILTAECLLIAGAMAVNV